jgi:predicted SAM-dependent methyltransferase
VKRLNLGAGTDIRAGWVNSDIVKLQGIDVVHDLDVFPWPWETGTVDEILANDLFEHVHDALGFVNECGRILKAGGFLRVRTPHYQHENSWTDPSHVRHCTEKSLDYWTLGTEFYEKYSAGYAAEGVAFERVNVTVEGGNILFILRRANAQ